MSFPTFTVESSSPTKNGNFCNKLINKDTITIETDFGKVKQERSTTYYLFTDKQNDEGLKAQLNLDVFDIVEKPYKFVDQETGAEEEISLKYLYPKRV